MARLSVKRIYEPRSETDGARILVDRLWPRGIAKSAIDVWLKDLAPSDDLRRQFHGRPDRWDEFRAAYAAELGGTKAQAALDILGQRLAQGPVTLLYAARDEDHNNAIALKLWLEIAK
ncbi:hypothetical protein ASE63_08665 [Bosea sp. Root381]|nr:hypothetical protein ASE63_08665 [Bosea sp. Root381]